jgi:hypothetical protein
MMNLESWIVSTGGGQATDLPDTRAAFWRVILANVGGGRRVYTRLAPLSLSAGIKNPQIRPFMSRAFVGTVPAEIPPPPPHQRGRDTDCPYPHDRAE